MNFCDAGNGRIAWIRAPDMGSARSLQTSRIILLKEEIVITPGIRAKLRVVVKRTEGERRAASHAASVPRTGVRSRAG